MKPYRKIGSFPKSLLEEYPLPLLSIYWPFAFYLMWIGSLYQLSIAPFPGKKSVWGWRWGERHWEQHKPTLVIRQREKKHTTGSVNIQNSPGWNTAQKSRSHLHPLLWGSSLPPTQGLIIELLILLMVSCQQKLLLLLFYVVRSMFFLDFFWDFCLA